ncbi:MAG: cell division protein SepF [Clostridia bacterium]|nr:cell division protein SepF [Clostridia bacterium]
MGIKKIFNNFLYGDNEEQNGYENNYTEDAENENFYDPEENDSGITATQMGSGVGITSGSAIEMIVVKPEKLETVTQIADYLVDRKTILLNLEDTNKETARRLIDFLNGVAYAINGDLRKVASNTYVVTPSNVELTGEKLSASTVAAFTKE